VVLEEFDVLKNVSDGAFEQCFCKDLIELGFHEILNFAMHFDLIADCFLY